MSKKDERQLMWLRIVMVLALMACAVVNALQFIDLSAYLESYMAGFNPFVASAGSSVAAVLILTAIGTIILYILFKVFMAILSRVEKTNK